MQIPYKRIELLANISIIFAALLVTTLLAKRFIIDRPSDPGSSSAQERVKVGTRVSLPDLDWSQSDRNLILILNKDCRFCTESASFYQRIVTETKNLQGVRVVAALPHELAVSSRYLSGLQVGISEIRQADPTSLGVRGTPTLLLVNKAGLITDIWSGKVPPDKEAEVLSRIKPNNLSNSTGWEGNPLSYRCYLIACFG